MSDYIEKKYGQFIKKRRKELGISQATLAEQLKCSTQAVSKYENDTVSIYLSSLSIICKVLKLDLTSFINQVNAKKNDYCDNHVFDDKKFASSLIYLREKELISQKELAEKIGVAPHKITKWETEKSTPSISEFVLLANFFKLTYEELYFSNFKIDNVPDDIDITNKKLSKRINPLFIAITAILLTITTGTSIAFGSAYFYEKQNNQNIVNGETCKITFLYKELNEKKEVYVEKNTTVSKPEFSHPGYILNGYTYKNLPFDFNTPIISDLVLTANLEKKVFNVNFLGLNNNIISKQRVKYKEAAIAPTNFDYKGYKFLGWDKDFSCVTENLNIHAILESTGVTANLICDASENEILETGETTKSYYNFTYDDIYSLPKAFKPNYQFLYWTTISGEELTKSTVLEKETNLYPCFIKKDKNAEITINNYDGLNNTKTFNFKINDKLTDAQLPYLYRDGRCLSHYEINNKVIDVPYLIGNKSAIEINAIWSNIKYDYEIIDEHSIKLKSVTTTAKTVFIPSKIKGYDVKYIGTDFLKNNNNVEKLIIEKPLIEIETNAFNSCLSLKEVYLNNDTQTLINKSIFNNCPNVSFISICGEVDSFNSLNFDEIGIQNKNDLTLEFNKYTQSLKNFYISSSYNNIKKIIFGENYNSTINFSFMNLPTSITSFEIKENKEYSTSCSIIFSSKYNNLDMNELIIPERFYDIEGTIAGKIKKIIIKNTSIAYLSFKNSTPIDILDCRTCNTIVINDEKTNIKFNKVAYLPNIIRKDKDSESTGVLIPPTKNSTFLTLFSPECDVYFKNADRIPGFYEGFDFIKKTENQKVNFHFGYLPQEL